MTTAGYGPYLEGVRGLAALYVVLHHSAIQVYDETYDSRQLSAAAGFWLKLCDRGDLAVTVFIVLSGYCLMLPVARKGHLRGGLLGYLRRRAQRILPPYYVAAAVVLALLWIAPTLNEPDGTRWDLALPALDRGVIASHAVLVHNFNADWIWKLNGPLWSVAVEWQLYAVFPLLIAAFRVFGIRTAIAAALALGYAITTALLVSDPALALRTCPWYLGMFAIGMAFAVYAQAIPAGPWFAIAVGCAAGAWAANELWSWAGIAADVGCSSSLVVDPLVGLALGCSLLHLARAHRGARTIFEHPLVLQLGAFSYSLYLLHDPLLSIMNRGMIALGWSSEVRVWASAFGAVPIAMLCSYALFAWVERPCLPHRPVLERAVRMSQHPKPMN